MKIAPLTLALALPAFGKTLVSSDKLQSKIKLRSLLAGSQKLQDFADANGGTRAFGSAGHNATVDYIVKELQKTGYYHVTKQPFTETYSEGNTELTVASKEIESNILTYSPSGDVSAALAEASNVGCDASDFSTDVKGKIALILRGECTFAVKVTNAYSVGAVGAIIYNNDVGSISGTLGGTSDEYVPSVTISQADGLALLESLSSGNVTADLHVEAIQEERVSYNVIAETKGGDHGNVLVVGGHSDSVPAGPGINDDGSGIIGILEVAKALSKFKIKNAVRFGFWSAEEFGLLGSNYYVKSVNSSAAEITKIRAYLNFDMIASPNYVYAIYDGDGSTFNLTGPAGSDVIEADFEKFFEKKGANHVATEFSGRSDYAAFIENGIPSGGLFTGAEGIKTAEEAKLFGGEADVAYDVNYHQAGDNITNLNHEAYLLNTKGIAYSVAKYALSFKSLPAVDAKQRRWAPERAHFSKRSDHGHSHAHSSTCGGVLE